MFAFAIKLTTVPEFVVDNEFCCGATCTDDEDDDDDTATTLTCCFFAGADNSTCEDLAETGTLGILAAAETVTLGFIAAAETGELFETKTLELISTVFSPDRLLERFI